MYFSPNNSWVCVEERLERVIRVTKFIYSCLLYTKIYAENYITKQFSTLNKDFLASNLNWNKFKIFYLSCLIIQLNCFVYEYLCEWNTPNKLYWNLVWCIFYLSEIVPNNNNGEIRGNFLRNCLSSNFIVFLSISLILLQTFVKVSYARLE